MGKLESDGTSFVPKEKKMYNSWPINEPNTEMDKEPNLIKMDSEMDIEKINFRPESPRGESDYVTSQQNLASVKPLNSNINTIHDPIVNISSGTDPKSPSFSCTMYNGTQVDLYVADITKLSCGALVECCQ